MIKVIISGEPKGKGRPRMSTKTGRTYTPKDTAMYENRVVLEYEAQCNIKHKGEIIAEIIAYYTIPKSASKTKHKQMVDGSIRPTKKPDADNVAKIILDSLNKIAFDDDSQVVDLSVKKFYSEQPRVELIISEVKGEC